MRAHRSVLPNGVRVIVVPVLGVESATTLVMYGAGSRYEERRLNGISHFLEHMAFKGTTNRPSAREISGLIDGIGAEFNAFTGKEYTGYYIKSATSHVNLCLDVLSDMLKNLLLDPTEIEKEKGVIIEEINLYEDTPSRKIGDIYEQLLYGDTPLGWDTGGTPEIIRSLKREDFIEYMGSLYSAHNMTVVVAGNVHVESMNKEIEKYFGDVPRFEYKKFLPIKEKQTKPIVMVKHKNTEQAHFALGVRTVGLHDKKDKYPLELLASILGGGMSSRLFYEIREKRGISYYARTMSDHYLDTGYLATYVGADPKRIDEAIQVVTDEYVKVSQKGEITEEELQKAKEYTKGHFVLELEDTRSSAVMYASQEILQKELHNPHEIMEKIEKVTLHDVVRVAKEYLDTKLLSLAVIGNFESEKRFEKLLK
ncbi:MAG: pitrilysin family protein [Candidatus Levybacteria bacterium]|nr:pitrilysin family protein [Candidatus Levybacteria bacterium]